MKVIGLERRAEPCVSLTELMCKSGVRNYLQKKSNKIHQPLSNAVLETEVSGLHIDKGLLVDSWGRGGDKETNSVLLRSQKRPDFKMITGGLEYIY